VSYRFNISFTNDQLEQLYATGTNVIAAKPSNEGGQPNVAWQVFKAMQSNFIEWEETYSMYASTSPVTNGEHLNQHSTAAYPCYMDKLYTLCDNGVVTGPSTGGQADRFALQNDFSSKDSMTFGLLQNANVNNSQVNGNGVTASPVIYKSTALMQPISTIYLWLQSGVASNTVLTVVTSPMSEFKFNSASETISVSYDSSSGHFIPDANCTLAKSQFRYIAPRL